MPGTFPLTAWVTSFSRFLYSEFTFFLKMIFWQILQIQTRKMRNILLGIGLLQNKKKGCKKRRNRKILIWAVLLKHAINRQCQIKIVNHSGLLFGLTTLGTGFFNAFSEFWRKCFTSWFTLKYFVSIKISFQNRKLDKKISHVILPDFRHFLSDILRALLP